MADKLLTLDQLLKELDKYSHKELHVHHTWRPNHSNFNGSNYQKVQDGMRRSHMVDRGFVDIAQHVTLFPDGKFLTGRKFNLTPASISGYNTGGFCVEMVGDFDKGKDKFEGKQKESMIKLAKYFYDKGKYIRFHRENAPKTCPGTSIDKEVFMKEVKASGVKATPAVMKPVTSPAKAETTKKPAAKTTVVYPGTLIKKGSKGANVGKIQKVVGVKVDNDFGANTEKAVKAYQKKNKLSADGIVGKATWNKMFN